MFKKIWELIKWLFKKFNFDNKKFEEGVYKIIDNLKVEVGKIQSIEYLWEKFINDFLKEFNNWYPLTKILNKAVKNIDLKLQTLVDFVDAEAPKQLEIIGKKLIDWYNENL